MRLPPATRERLELLRKILLDLEGLGRERVTSQELARWAGTTAASVRKDLSWCRASTEPGPYQAGELARRIVSVLEPVPRGPWRTALAGLGEWGLGLAEEMLRRSDRYTLLAGFDSRANRLETIDVPFALYPTTEILPVSLKLSVDLAILAVPVGEAQKVAERFIQGGVRRLVNYSSATLRVNRRQIWVRECGL